MPKLISQKNFKNIITSNLTTSSTNQIALDIFSKGSYRSAKYQIQIERESSYHTTEISLIHDGTNVYVTEYGTITSNGILGTFDCDILSLNVRLLVTPNSATSTTFKLIKTVITL